MPGPHCSPLHNFLLCTSHTYLAREYRRIQGLLAPRNERRAFLRGRSRGLCFHLIGHLRCTKKCVMRSVHKSFIGQGEPHPFFPSVGVAPTALWPVCKLLRVWGV